MKSDLMKWANVLRIFLKVIPMLMAGCSLLNNILAYFGIYTVWINYIAGVSLLPMAFLYVASYAFQFCEYHRMFLHYIIVNNIINWIDAYIGIPISDLEFLILSLVVAGIFLFFVLRLKFGNKTLN